MREGQTLAMCELERVEDRPFVAAPFAGALLKAQEDRGNLVVLTADLGKYTDVHPFRDAHPDRFFNVGMAEQALVTVAAGLARTGLVPFCTTYGCFATRRAYDFLAIACAHGNAPVKMFAALPGLTTGYGGTHQAIEDLALMRAIPDMTVIDPCDATEMTQVVEMAARTPGTLYCRLLRGNVPVVLDPVRYQFVLGRAVRLRPGAAIGFISTGFMTERCLDAATALSSRGIDCAVLHCPTIKPFDVATTIDFVRSVGRIVVVENHVTIGGLASLVFDAMIEAGLACPVLKIGLPDRFMECGSVPFLQDKYGLTTPRVIERVAAWMDTRLTGSKDIMEHPI